MSHTPDQCWRRIGVYGGNHSCERLAAEIHCRNCTVFASAARVLLKRESEPLPPLSDPLQSIKDKDSRSVLAFRLGREWLGLRCDRVAEVAEARQPRRIAHRGDGQLEGLVAVRGELHLCVALIEALQLGSRSELSGERSRLILLAPPQAAPIAFRCSEVIGLRSVCAADIEEVPATLPAALARCLSGVVAFEHGRMALLEEGALLAALDEVLYA
jgi:chemotaxis-related protein WspD